MGSAKHRGDRVLSITYLLSCGIRKPKRGITVTNHVVRIIEAETFNLRLLQRNREAVKLWCPKPHLLAAQIWKLFDAWSFLSSCDIEPITSFHKRAEIRRSSSWWCYLARDFRVIIFKIIYSLRYRMGEIFANLEHNLPIQGSSLRVECIDYQLNSSMSLLPEERGALSHAGLSRVRRQHPNCWHHSPKYRQLPF